MPFRLSIIALLALLIAAPDVGWAGVGKTGARFGKKALGKRPSRWKEVTKRLTTAVVIGALVAPSVSGCVGPFSSDNRAVGNANICEVYDQKGIDWYTASRKTAQTHKIKQSFVESILAQESNFDANARASYWFNPWGSSAAGAAQVLDGTWADYQAKRGNGRHRDNYADAMDFIGWYKGEAERIAQRPLSLNEYAQAYNGGPGNLKKGTVSKDAKAYADSVIARMYRYDQQKAKCGNKLELDARPVLQKLTDGLKELF